MKKILAPLLGLFSTTTKAEQPKLGSESDPIRQMLFASQSLKEQVSRKTPDSTPGPFQTITDALKLSESGQREAAVAKLKSVLETAELETRIQLWVWTGLRELNIQPESKNAYEVLGVVIEYPSGSGYDTLATYADGSARYLNYSGKAIFWDIKDTTIKNLGQAVINAALPVSERATPRTSLSLPKNGAQATLLTRAGIFAFNNPPNSVINAAAALMIELMQRSKKSS